MSKPLPHRSRAPLSRAARAACAAIVALMVVSCTSDEAADPVAPVPDAGGDATSDAAAPEPDVPSADADTAEEPEPDTAPPDDATRDAEPVLDAEEPDTAPPDDASTDTTEPTPDTGEAPESYAGEWSGSWQADGALPLNGSFVLILEEHDGPEIEGEASFTGAPCFSFAFVDALVDEGAFTADLYDDEISITITGTITATRLTGTFEAVDAGFCSGYTGEIEATRLVD